MTSYSAVKGNSQNKRIVNAWITNPAFPQNDPPVVKKNSKWIYPIILSMNIDPVYSYNGALINQMKTFVLSLFFFLFFNPVIHIRIPHENGKQNCNNALRTLVEKFSKFFASKWTHVEAIWSKLLVVRNMLVWYRWSCGWYTGPQVAPAFTGGKNPMGRSFIRSLNVFIVQRNHRPHCLLDVALIAAHYTQYKGSIGSISSSMSVKWKNTPSGITMNVNNGILSPLWKNWHSLLIFKNSG